MISRENLGTPQPQTDNLADELYRAASRFFDVSVSADHKLYKGGEAVPYMQAADHGNVISPTAIVLHYTAGKTAAADAAWLAKQDKTYLSAHVVLGRDGSLCQLLPCNVMAYHAGASYWKGRNNLNGWSVGIEMTNFGWLRKDADGTFRSWSGHAVPASEVVEAKHKNGWPEFRYWHRFTAVQVATAVAVCRALLQRYPRIDTIVGHDDIAPRRKQDPGPAFPLECVRLAALKGLRLNT